MGKRGPKPRPTRLRVLDGNPSKRPLNDREPMPKRGVPACPDWLDQEARAKWEQLAPEMDRLGLLTLVDGDALVAYCVAFARWQRAERELRQSGDVLKSRDGGLYQSPYLSVANRALENMRKQGALFGLSPADRTKLAVPGGEKDDFEEFLREKA